MDIRKIIREETDEMDWIRLEGHNAPSERDVLNTPIQATVGSYMGQYGDMFFTFFTDGPQIFEILPSSGGGIEYLIHENMSEFGKYLSSPSNEHEWSSIDDYLNEFPAVRELVDFDSLLYRTMKSKFPFITKAYVGEL
jgi:hypothetical protein